MALKQRHQVSKPGGVIKTRRLELGCSAAELARQLGVAPQAVCNWETKPGRGPSRTHWVKLADILGVGIHDLFGFVRPHLSVQETELVDGFRFLSQPNRDQLLMRLRLVMLEPGA